MTTYTITTWTDFDGVKHAVWGETYRAAITGDIDPKRVLAKWMLDQGLDPTARVYFQNENGGKLGSVASLAELGRVRG